MTDGSQAPLGVAEKVLPFASTVFTQVVSATFEEAVVLFGMAGTGPPKAPGRLSMLAWAVSICLRRSAA